MKEIFFTILFYLLFFSTHTETFIPSPHFNQIYGCALQVSSIRCLVCRHGFFLKEDMSRCFRELDEYPDGSKYLITIDFVIPDYRIYIEPGYLTISKRRTGGIKNHEC